MAVLLACLAPAVHARAAAGMRPPPPPRGGASLSLSPQSGGPKDPITATYSYGSACPDGATVVFRWDGQEINAASPGGGSCGLRSSLVPPPSAAGGHVVSAILLDGDGAPVPGGAVAQNYTLTDATPPAPPTPVTIVPSQGPPTMPATPPPADTPPPGATPTPPGATPTPAPGVTPVPTLVPEPVAGTFEPYACRNGIPDTTPCPGAVAALAAPGSGRPSSSPGAARTGSASSSVPTGGLVGLAFLAILLAAGLVALAWRSGNRGRTLSRPGR